MLKGIANLIAKAAIRNARKKRLGLPKSKYAPVREPEEWVENPPSDILKFLLPPTRKLPNYPMLKPPGGIMTPSMIKALKKQNMGQSLKDIQANTAAIVGKGNIRNIFRGETMFPEEKFISKAGLASNKKPGTWWSTDPWESADYAIRPSKGIMGTSIKNPGVMRRIKVDKDISDLPEGWVRGSERTHVHPTQTAIDDSKISMVYSVVNRLREMGWSKGQIFKYVRMIMNKKNAAGKRDWMLYNSGGKV